MRGDDVQAVSTSGAGLWAGQHGHHVMQVSLAVVGAEARLGNYSVKGLWTG